MNIKIKRLSNPVKFLIPMLAVSFLAAGLAQAQRSHHSPSHHSSYKGHYNKGYSSYNKGYSSYNKGYSKGYNSYGKGYYGAKKYTPTIYTVKVLFGHNWVTKYYGSSYTSAHTTAKYYKSRGLSVRL